MKRMLCAMLCLACIFALAPARAATTSLDEQMAEFMAQNALDAENFALCYIDTVTGESYSYNEDAFFPVGRVWILPLHMYYYEREARGDYEPEYDEDGYLEEEFTIGGLTLEECRYRSIIGGDEKVSAGMRNTLGNFAQYKQLVNDTYGGYDSDLLPDEYFTSNAYNAKMLITALNYLNVRPEFFGGLTANLRMVQKDDGIAGYSGGYSLVHLRGEEEGVICDLGAVDAQRPYLLACFVKAEKGDEILAQVNDLLCTYNEENEPEQGHNEPLPAPIVLPSEEELPIVQDSPKTPDGTSPALLWGGLALTCVAGGTALLLRRKRRR
ncbi:MAG: hypothetical protein LBM28_07545 [Oscillospiraceae bacterium]|jgi:hypothetical protein|nr:hypothetical protein [Oscillospiraceae bacterium]